MEYKQTPSNALVKSIINSPLDYESINNINFEYLIKKYKTYEQTYRHRCIKINDDYVKKIDNIEKKINALNKSIIKELFFCKKSENSLKYISQIIKIDTDELFSDDINTPYIMLSDMYSKKKENKFSHSFISSLYSINRTYLSSNNISFFSLWDSNTINKELISYKNSFINKLENETTKTKIFINQIKKYQLNLCDLNIKTETLKNQIIKFRTKKIEFYKDKCSVESSSYQAHGYDNVYNKLFNNKTIKVGALNKFFFFDNKDIFQKIIEIKNYQKEINKIEKEIKLTE